MIQETSNLKSFLEMVEQDDYLILDTETTGLKWGEICQIAIIESTGEVHFDCLVKTQNPIPPDAIAVHGITDEMVADSPTWDLLVEPLRELLAGRDLVVYNAVYDRKMMHQSAERCRLPKTDWKLLSRWWCAMEAYAEYYGEWNEYHGNCHWQPLAAAARNFKIPTPDTHTALGDAVTTLRVCQAMLHRTQRS